MSKAKNTADSGADLSNYLTKTGGTLTGNLSFADDGEGILLSGGGKLLGTTSATVLDAKNNTFLLRSGDGATEYLRVVAPSTFEVFGVPFTSSGAFFPPATPVTAATINTAITAANAAGGGIVPLPPGSFNINATINMKSNVKLVANGLTTLTTPSMLSGDVILGSAVSNCSVEGITIVGSVGDTWPGTDSNNGGINFISGSSRILIRDCIVKNFNANGINFNLSNSNFEVTSCQVYNCRVGISVFKDNRFFKISHNYIERSVDIGINVDDATTPDTADTNLPNFYGTVHDNSITYTGMRAGANGISCQGSYYIDIHNNQIHLGGRYPATWVTCNGIVVNGGQGDYDVSSYIRIADNTIAQNAGAGIYIGSSASCLVQGNIVLDNWQYQTALGTNIGEIHIQPISAATKTFVTGNSIFVSGTGVGGSQSSHCIANYAATTDIGENSYRGVGGTIFAGVAYTDKT